MIHYIRNRDELRAIASDCTLVVTRELTRSPFLHSVLLRPELAKRAERDRARLTLDSQRALA